MRKREFILYGINSRREIIKEILSDLNVSELNFDLELIISEALNNAYIHGNKKDETKPIYLRYYCNNKKLNIEVEDCGQGLNCIKVPDEIPEEDLLNENGRGLFLINCFADKVVVNANVIKIKKNLKASAI